ncbi:Rieske 2Fe-2S domain-containing protein [Streptomyces sp. NPDC001978]|uniref:Rieske 2Fe-2S domain-containing protein n=1 Tax=Streptomyces sp. NPDC001978 TaxID=3364627 RepID=UPI00367394A4
MHGFPHGYASGWYQVGWSSEFAPGADAVPMRYFEQDLVCYRTESGQLRISDAFCPHLGAHLGYGGSVEGDCLVCPFHGWKWDSEGRNVDIPYSDPDRMKLRLGQREVREVDGLVLMWYGADNEPPSWEAPRLLPEGSDHERDYWAIWPDTSKLWAGLKFPPQVATENSGDAAHFHYVHGAAEVPLVEEWDSGEHWFRTSFEATFGGHRPTTWATPQGPVKGRIVTTCHGMGIAAGLIESFDTVYTLAATTPVDRETSDHRATIWVPRKRGDGSDMSENFRDRWAKQQISQHEADFPVWENMTYIAKPAFTATEVRSFHALRRWIEGQYSPEAG